jgi:predicted small lipoprotein YifL
METPSHAGAVCRNKKRRRKETMRFKMFALLALLLEMAACGGKATPTLPATATPDPADITLMPYTSEEMGIRGVVPAGWVEVKPGHFQPAPGTDPTLLGQVAFPGVPLEQIAAATQFPESAGSRETMAMLSPHR